LLAELIAAAVQARVLHRLGLGGQRHQPAHGAPLLGPAGLPERHTIISRHNAYHGSTMAGASLGGMDGMHEQGGLPIPGIVHIGQPNWFESGQGMSETSSASWRPAGWKRRSWKWAPTRWPPSSANRCRAPAA
jgi:4-aminobutyrate aminotransferase-like enzyme